MWLHNTTVVIISMLLGNQKIKMQGAQHWEKIPNTPELLKLLENCFTTAKIPSKNGLIPKTKISTKLNN